MDKKQKSETTDKQAAPEVKDEALDQIHGGCKAATAAPTAATIAAPAKGNIIMIESNI